MSERTGSMSEIRVWEGEFRLGTRWGNSDLNSAPELDISLVLKKHGVHRQSDKGSDRFALLANPLSAERIQLPVRRHPNEPPGP